LSCRVDGAGLGFGEVGGAKGGAAGGEVVCGNSGDGDADFEGFGAGGLGWEG
jgi:hypothetical protein